MRTPKFPDTTVITRIAEFYIWKLRFLCKQYTQFLILFLQATQITSLHSINLLVFIKEKKCVYYEVGTLFLTYFFPSKNLKKWTSEVAIVCVCVCVCVSK